MNPLKLVWKVSPTPTGPYRAFETRTWPSAYYKGSKEKLAVTLSCIDQYVPSQVRAGTHAPIQIVIMHHTHPLAGNTWRRMLLKQPAATLAEAKRMAFNFLVAHPEYHPKEV